MHTCPVLMSCDVELPCFPLPHPVSYFLCFSLFFFIGAGNVSALFLFLAPVITFKRVIKNKSTEKFSGIPYAMTLLNCLLSAWKLFCGFAAAIFSIIMYGSSLSIMGVYCGIETMCRD
ncbi:hypothetical protein VNO77_10211 [Canavalia gladiata]|uniref:Uncharacterized protein n=1 Tax=Canavalia gladiata TaxID=3824 RepID=A0AAN9MA48_CANGL